MDRELKQKLIPLAFYIGLVRKTFKTFIFIVSKTSDFLQRFLNTNKPFLTDMIEYEDYYSEIMVLKDRKNSDLCISETRRCAPIWVIIQYKRFRILRDKTLQHNCKLLYSTIILHNVTRNIIEIDLLCQVHCQPRTQRFR